MASAGLLYVGAILFINGLMLLGWIPGKSAAILNLFVGALQVIVPVVLLTQAEGEPAATFAAAGLFLFGFTYLYVGILQLAGISPEGLGWFSLFVAVVAVVIGVLSFGNIGDPLFGSIWLAWSVLWFMFFLLMGLGKESIAAMTGWFAIFCGWLTCAIPALLLLSGAFVSTGATAAVGGTVFAASFGVALYLGRPENPVGVRRDVRAAVSKEAMS
ncbi:transporter [Arthrobacter sp. CAU 1506]|uniref:AmiS/UreI family transporter n=1 Tax=Arthrobacter sp. CAU 1506 TaxID=2560052 RepID=UPI0010ACEB01|nr:AmiS/UreI family transporter [Arthrobacter sp. CAU 1506]TJY68825.1 transporter [Arthrobacter sp. CAU 1506]